MTAENLFSLANLLAVAGWLVLIVAGRSWWAGKLVTGAVLPLLFAVLYSGLIAVHWKNVEGGFGSLASVQLLFSNPWLLLAGWVHYLAFDLFIGNWEVRDAQEHGVPHWSIVPSLVLTFLFGPLGFLLYFVIRAVKTRRLTLNGEQAGTTKL
jgi:hypothetical protein